MLSKTNSIVSESSIDHINPMYASNSISSEAIVTRKVFHQDYTLDGYVIESYIEKEWIDG